MAETKLGCGSLGLILGGIVAVVIALSPGKTPEQQQQDQSVARAMTIASTMEHQVKSVLRDPESAVVTPMAGDGCGTVNARNGFGGMTGDQRFVIDRSTDPNTVWLEDDGGRPFRKAWARQCGGMPKVQLGRVDQKALDELLKQK